MASFSDDPIDVVPSGQAAVALDTVPAWLRPRYVAAAVVALPVVALVFARSGASGDSFVAACVVAVLAVLSAIDIAERRLPNEIVLPAAAMVFVAQSVLAPERTLELALAGVGAALLLLLPRLFYPAGLGMGDVKLALLLGAALGSAVLAALFLGVVAAAAYGVFLLVRDGASARRATIPLGPFLAFGAVAVLLL